MSNWILDKWMNQWNIDNQEEWSAEKARVNPYKYHYDNAQNIQDSIRYAELSAEWARQHSS